MNNDSIQKCAGAGDDRFAFGANWRSFLDQFDESRITEAERSLQWLLGRDRLDGLTFLDIGSGSGLSSLAAWRLGAAVHSFDYDPQSVACTTLLRDKFCPAVRPSSPQVAHSLGRASDAVTWRGRRRRRWFGR